MVNTRTKFPRGILDRVISLRAHDGGRERALDPGLKPQASSTKLQAPRLLTLEKVSSTLNQGAGPR